MRARSLPLLLLLPLAAAPLAAQETTSEGWDVEDARAPTSMLEFTATEGTWLSLDVAPDAETVVFDLLGHLYEMPAEGGDARPLTEGRSWNMLPRYSPDGTRIAFTSDRSGSRDLWVLERATGELTNVSDRPENVYRPSWGQDGRYLYGTVMKDIPGGAGEFTQGVRYNLRGGHQPIGESGSPVNQFQEVPSRGLVLYERLDGPLPDAAARILAYDIGTGEEETWLERRGGAFNPTVSPDGRRLAYQHRDHQETVLVVRDLETLEERVVLRGLDRDRQETVFHSLGATPNMAWGPGGRELWLAVGGEIRAVEVATGATREVPFEAPVRREVNETIRFRADIPTDSARTRLHRWAQRTEDGVLSEALGDLWLRTENGPSRNLTDSPEHETSPLYDPRTRTLYYAAWSDDALGELRALPLEGEATPRTLTSVAAPYGSLALSPDGGALAALRGAGSVRTGGLLTDQTEFELVLVDVEGGEEARLVTEVAWRARSFANHAHQRPPGVAFDPDGEHLWFTEFVGDTLALKRIRTDGLDERTTHLFPHATRAIPSPDLRWIAFREFHRHWVSPNDWLGETLRLSAADGQGWAKRVDREDGIHLSWSTDGATLQWSRGATLREKPLEAVLATEGESESAAGGAEEGTAAAVTDLSVTFPVARSAGALALTGVTVLTMDAEGRVLEDATVVVRAGRIEAVGADVAVPEGAEVMALDGHVVIPGMVDAHAHPDPYVSSLNVIEQRPPANQVGLAFGVTTQYEVYGTERKDPWLSDMVRAGRIDAPRLFTVGTPLFGLKHFRPKLYRPIDSYEDALEHVRYNADHGADAIKDYLMYTRADRHMLATAAREAGVNVLAESAAEPAMNFTQLIDGETGLEHTPGLTPLYDDAVRLLAHTEAGITPTLLVVYNGPLGERYFHVTERVWENEKLLRFLPEEQLLAVRRPTFHWPEDRYATEMAAAMKELWDAGVSIQVGGHGQMYGVDMHWEMELLTRGGFTPLEALEAATIRGARYHGLDHRLGSVEAGKLADLVVLSADPREAIRNSREIRYVMRNGFLYDGDTLAPVWPEEGEAKPMYFRER